MTETTTRISPAELDRLNLADPRLHAETDLSEVWRQLRTDDPVHWNPAIGSAPGFWVVTTHADVVEVYRDTTRFTSENGNVLETLLRGGDSAGGRMLAITDGHRHAELRRALLPAFTVKALEPVARSVRRATRDLIGRAVEAGTCDFAGDVAARIPLGAICDLLGVPEPDRMRVLALTSSALSSEHADNTAGDSWIAKNEILLYFADLARTRRDSGHFDVISLLAAGKVDGACLDEDEVILNCYSLLLGGDETTRLAMIGGVAALLAHPDQWQALQRGEVDVDVAVEEILRWTTPGLHGGRTVTVDTKIEGRRISAGDIVTVWNCSANRDERVFARPDRLLLDRTPNRHLTFAHGPHFCLGAHLARIELGAVLAELRDQVAEMAQTAPARPIYSNFLRGLSTLPVAFTPR